MTRLTDFNIQVGDITTTPGLLTSSWAQWRWWAPHTPASSRTCPSPDTDTPLSGWATVSSSAGDSAADTYTRGQTSQTSHTDRQTDKRTNIAKELPNAVRPVMQGRIRSFTFWPQLPSSLLYSGWREDKNSVAFSPLSANLTKTNYNPRHNRFIAVTKNLIVQSENLGWVCPHVHW